MIPTVGIEIDVANGDPYILPKALHAGVRHVHFVLREANPFHDTGTKGKNVFTLRLLETLGMIRNARQMRLAFALYFSMRVPAEDVALLAEVSRTLKTFNLRLDLSSVSFAGASEAASRAAWAALCALHTEGLTASVAAHGSL